MIRIQPAGAAASVALAAIHAEAFETSHDEAWSADVIASLMAGPGVFAQVANFEEEPAGFILCRTVVDEAEVLTLATRPAFHRRGVASALLDAAAAAARAGGATTLFLEVAWDNPGAEALYLGQGFHQVGTRPAYYSRPAGAVPGLIMRLDLIR